jgi:flavin-binding protein dodecin
MDLTLDQLLASLESGMNKSAEDSSEDDKGEKKELPPFMKKDDGEDKSEKSEKSDKEDDDEDCEDKQEKKASDAGAALAREIMEKVASINLDNGMNKQASTAGQALAQALLKQAQTKKASAGDMITTDGIAPGAVPNKNQVDNAAMESEGAATVKPMLTGDGIKNQGTVNEIFDAMIADALSQGAASTDQVHTTGLSAPEGAVEDHAVPNQVKVAEEQELQDQIEKAAAVSHLVSQGLDFDTAFELVKQAEQEIAYEMEKSAAMEALMDDGISFEDAVELVKQASAGDLTTVDGVAPGVVPNKNQVDNAAMEGEGAATVKPMPTGDGVRNQGTVNEIFDAVIADAMGQGAASTDQVHTTGVSSQEGNVEDHAVPNQVKVAAMNELLEAGVDFDEAAEFIKEAGMVAARKAARAATGPIFRTAKPSTLAGEARRVAMNAGADAKSAIGAAGTKVKSYAGGAGNTVKDIGKTFTDKVKDMASDAYTAGEVLVDPSKYGRMQNGRTQALKSLATNPLVYGTAGTLAAGGAGAYAMGREKKAALDELLEDGFDFDYAVDLIKEASLSSETVRKMGGGAKKVYHKAVDPSIMTRAKSTGRAAYSSAKSKGSAALDAIKDKASDAYTAGEVLVNPSKYGRMQNGRTQALKSLATNPLVYGTAGTLAAGGAGAYALGREKKAAVDMLMDAGIDFDSAVTLVNDKAQELYGE